jgi:hypothetical protein
VRARRGGTPSPLPIAILVAFAVPSAASALPPPTDSAEDVAAEPPVPDAADPQGDAAAEADAAGADEDEISRFYLPPLPFYQETTASSGFRLFFPLYYETWDDRAREHALGVLPFYWRWRGPDELHETDVVLGLYWRYRRPERFTDVAGPLYVSRTTDGYDVGLPPLFMVGADAETDYQILGLYFWRFASETSTFALAPPFYYYRAPARLAYGVAPLVFGGETDGAGYATLLGLLWHLYDDRTGASTSVVPPLFVDIDENGDWTAGVAPVLFFGGGEDSAHFTLFPAFHYAQDGEKWRFITPVAWYQDDPENDTSGGGALLYHWWNEGPSYFRTLAPVWFSWGNDDTGEHNDVIGPVYHGSTPVSSDWVGFPFWWDFHQYEKSRSFGFMPLFFHHTSLYEERSTTWVFPSFEYSEWPRTGPDPEGWAFNLHPIVYVGADGEDSHQVVFPIWWNFDSPDSRTTIGFPLWWDFVDRTDGSRFWTAFPLVWHSSDPDSSLTVAVNTVYTEERQSDGTESWHFHFIPLFDVGRARPEDLSWSILYGLAGYERRGIYERIQIFWLPIEI